MEKSVRDREIRAGKASQDQAAAKKASKSGKGKDSRGKESDDLRRQILKDAVKEGIRSARSKSPVSYICYSDINFHCGNIKFYWRNHLDFSQKHSN